MNTNHGIGTFSKLHEAIQFYLDHSFYYIEESLRSELSDILFSRELDKINPSSEDRKIISEVQLEESPIELLRVEVPEVLSAETIEAISIAMDKAKVLSRNMTHKFSKQHQINAIEILGHLNNFGFFIETLVNRHLLYMKLSGNINDLSYSRISISRVMERILFIFKGEINGNKLHLNEIVNLFSLRNKTVHYTPENANALKPKISELIAIWNQAVKLIKMMEKHEKFADEKFSILLNNKIKQFKIDWQE